MPPKLQGLIACFIGEENTQCQSGTDSFSYATIPKGSQDAALGPHDGDLDQLESQTT